MLTTIDFPHCETRTRTLHLVDIENLIGDPYADGDVAVDAFDRYLELAGWEVGDLLYVAANPRLAFEFGVRRPDVAMRSGVGPDAADMLLLAQAAPEFVVRRADRLVIGSGDHIFIERALAVRSEGIGVLVVARPGSASSGWRAHGFPCVPFVREPDSLAA
jgi:hypothetical protein